MTIMNTQIKKINEAFTIVEVMIVLSIAALILLVVFKAVPQLQRSSRNTQRNGDAYKVLSAVNECLSNNNGPLSSCQPSTAANTFDSATAPTAGSGPILGSSGYLDLNKIQLLTTLRIYAPSSTPAFPAIGNSSSAYAFGGYYCTNGATFSNANAGINQFVILYNREVGSSTSNVCISP